MTTENIHEKNSHTIHAQNVWNETGQKVCLVELSRKSMQKGLVVSWRLPACSACSPRTGGLAPFYNLQPLLLLQPTTYSTDKKNPLKTGKKTKQKNGIKGKPKNPLKTQGSRDRLSPLYIVQPATAAATNNFICLH